MNPQGLRTAEQRANEIEYLQRSPAWAAFHKYLSERRDIAARLVADADTPHQMAIAAGSLKLANDLLGWADREIQAIKGALNAARHF